MGVDYQVDYFVVTPKIFKVGAKECLRYERVGGYYFIDLCRRVDVVSSGNDMERWYEARCGNYIPHLLVEVIIFGTV